MIVVFFMSGRILMKIGSSARMSCFIDAFQSTDHFHVQGPLRLGSAGALKVAHKKTFLRLQDDICRLV